MGGSSPPRRQPGDACPTDRRCLPPAPRPDRPAPRHHHSTLVLATIDDALLRAGAVLLRWAEGFVEPIVPPPAQVHLVTQRPLTGVAPERSDALGATGPSVVSLTGVVASLAVTEFPVWVTRLREPPSRLIYDAQDGRGPTGQDQPGQAAATARRYSRKPERLKSPPTDRSLVQRAPERPTATLASRLGPVPSTHATDRTCRSEARRPRRSPRRLGGKGSSGRSVRRWPRVRRR